MAPPSTVHYYSSNLQTQYQYTKEYYKDDNLQIVQEDPKQDYLGFKPDLMMDKPQQDYEVGYKTPMIGEQYPTYSNSPLMQTYIPHNEERSDVESEVDTREFDKYLKYQPETSVIDSNHNYRNDGMPPQNQPTNNYNYHAQHTSVILPTNSSVKPEPLSLMGHYAEVYHHETAQNGVNVQKSDDDFSEILADVRKTCYSN